MKSTIVNSRYNEVGCNGITAYNEIDISPQSTKYTYFLSLRICSMLRNAKFQKITPLSMSRFCHCCSTIRMGCHTLLTPPPLEALHNV